MLVVFQKRQSGKKFFHFKYSQRKQICKIFISVALIHIFVEMGLCKSEEVTSEQYVGHVSSPKPELFSPFPIKPEENKKVLEQYLFGEDVNMKTQDKGYNNLFEGSDDFGEYETETSILSPSHFSQLLGNLIASFYSLSLMDIKYLMCSSFNYVTPFRTFKEMKLKIHTSIF